MAQAIQELTNFDIAEKVYIETPGALCVVSSSDPQTFCLELWDINQNTLPFRVASSGELEGAIQLLTADDPSSVAWLAFVAGYLAAPTTEDDVRICQGFPNGAVGGIIYLPCDAGAAIAFNFAGTVDGSVGSGSGIGINRAGPVGFGPRLIQPGGSLKFGRFLD